MTMKDLKGRIPQVSGITFTWSRAKPIGSRILSLMVNGQPISPTHTYTLATNDYIQGGGDGYTSLGNGQVVVSPKGGTLLATVVIAAVQQQQTLSLATDGRITEVH